MSGTVHAVFENHLSAAIAVEKIKSAGFASSRFSIIGEDSDNFRTATAALQSTRCDQIIFWAGIIGAGLGCISGLLGLPHFPERNLYYLMFVPLGAALSGTAVGMIMGMLIGGVLRLDDIPNYEANVKLGTISDAAMSISVSFSNEQERHQLINLFAAQNATYVAIGAVSQESTVEEPYRLPVSA